MKHPKDLPILTSLLWTDSFLKSNFLNGLFYCPENFTILNKGNGYTCPDKSYVFLKDSQIHSDAGFSVVFKNDDDDRLTEGAYFKHGRLHNEKGPAVVTYDKELMWDGANFIVAKDGVILEYLYSINGQQHRIDGPSSYNMKTQKFEWSICGVKYNEKEFEQTSEVIEYKKSLLKLKMNNFFS